MTDPTDSQAAVPLILDRQTTAGEQISANAIDFDDRNDPANMNKLSFETILPTSVDCIVRTSPLSQRDRNHNRFDAQL